MANLQPKKNINLDGLQEHGFFSFYKTLSEKPLTTVRLFDRGDYYTVHGECAQLAAKELFHTSSVIKHIGSGSNSLESVALSQLNFESFVRDLLFAKQYRVEIYKQRSSVKNDWELFVKASPGNLGALEEILFGESSEKVVNTGVMAVKIITDSGQRKVGVGYVDVDSQAIMVSEFSDNDCLNNLEAVVIHLAPKECLTQYGEAGSDAVQLKRVLTRSHLLTTERKRGDFSSNDIIQDLSRLLKAQKGDSSGIAARPELEKVVSTSALAAVIKYLDLLTQEDNFGKFKLSSYELTQFMKLDNAAMRALHVDSFSSGMVEDIHNKNNNILGLLDKCRTAGGHRLLAQWIRQPLVDVNKIEERLDLVEALTTTAELRSALSEDHLRRIPDISRLSRRFSKKSATLQDCYKLYQCVAKLPNLYHAFVEYEGIHKKSLMAAFAIPLNEVIADLEKFQEMIDTTLDMDQVSQGEFVIKSDFDEDLAELRVKMCEYEKKLDAEFKKCANDLGLEAGKTIKFENNLQIGYFMRITLKEEKVLRNNRSYSIIDTNKAGVRFRNNIIENLNNFHKSAREDYVRQQKSVVDEIISIASGYVEVFLCLGNLLSDIDCIFSLAFAATSAPIAYVRPKLLLSDKKMIKLAGCRHPCLELQEDVSFIPNDCVFNEENGYFHIITGPNMGGKSTFLRSVGVAVLMAHIGSFVACEEAELSVVDSIFARVGSSDCLAKGVSTFMAEMLETSTILKSATKSSLILIDELGRGTSTYDGFGLAWSISEFIAKEINSYCLFATHFHELTALADEVKSVKNFHVLATTDNGMLTLLYKVICGPCDRSFGIHVAELANFPSYIIKEGEKIIEEFLKNVGSLDVEKLSDDQLLEKMNSFKHGLEKNSYVAHIISNCS